MGACPQPQHVTLAGCPALFCALAQLPAAAKAGSIQQGVWNGVIVKMMQRI